MIPPATRWWWVRPHVYRAGWLDQTTRVEPDQPAPAGPGKNRSRKKVLNLEQIVWKWEKGWILNKVFGNEKMGAECQMCFYQCFVWRLFSDGFCYDGNLDLNQGRIWNIKKDKKNMLEVSLHVSWRKHRGVLKFFCYYQFLLQIIIIKKFTKQCST